MRLSRITLAASLLALSLGACAQQPTSVPLRSLERSGKLTLLCLDPLSSTDPGYSIEDCQAQRLATKPGGSGYPVQLYALVNQTTRGEVAVLDINAVSVVDVDPSTPGYRFLPVGAEPVDIVSTPGGNASFVAVAEANRPGIYALASEKVRSGPPTLPSWPACALPGRPGRMAMVVARDVATPARGKTACENPAIETKHDRLPELGKGPDLSLERGTPGVRKLAVTLPDTGDLLIIDAQRLLDRDPGSYDPCPIDRRVKLEVNLPPSTTLSPQPDGVICPAPPDEVTSPRCPVRSPQVVSYDQVFEPKPASVTVLDNSLVITDEGAPVIHRIDLADPCDPRETTPLWPSAYDDPGKPITTREAAISPVTHDGKRFLYAVDATDGSAMVFDISDVGGKTTPLVLDRPDLLPFARRDRIQLGAPIRSLSFVTQEIPVDNGAGNLVSGIVCDPSPGAGDGALFRSSSDYASGAGPLNLRGVFAVAALTSGAVVVVDVDDLDAPCRRYRSISGATDLPAQLTGCQHEGDAGVCVDDPLAQYTGATGEGSCRVVQRHFPRGRNYFAAASETGPHLPFTQTFPSLTFAGTTVSPPNTEDGRKAPAMLAPQGLGGDWVFVRGDSPVVLATSPSGAENHSLLPDFVEPRYHFDEDYNVTYEGLIPGFDAKVARISLSVPRDGQATPDANIARRGFFDPNAYFCALGVHDERAARLVGTRLGLPRSAALDAFARDHADQIEIANDLIPDDDPYWSTTGDRCSFLRCRANFGTAASPSAGRSFPIKEAYQDRVLVDYSPVRDVTSSEGPEGATLIEPECCFPTLVTYRVRARSTWVAIGSSTGFAHHVIADADGRCVDAGVVQETGEVCDSSLQLRTSRAYELPKTETGRAEPLALGTNDARAPYIFFNGQFRFVLYEGLEPSKRDMRFTFRLGGGFVPLLINSGRGAVSVAPEAMFYHPALGSSLVVTDGSLQGVQTLNLRTFTVDRTFF